MEGRDAMETTRQAPGAPLRCNRCASRTSGTDYFTGEKSLEKIESFCSSKDECLLLANWVASHHAFESAAMPRF